MYHALYNVKTRAKTIKGLKNAYTKNSGNDDADEMLPYQTVEDMEKSEWIEFTKTGFKILYDGVD